MSRFWIAALAVSIAAPAYAESDCSRVHAECAAQRQTCAQNRLPVRNGHDPNAACDQMARARCDQAAQCDRQAAMERRRERHQKHELEREAEDGAAYQAGFQAGQAASGDTKQKSDDDSPAFWTGEKRDGHRKHAEEDEPAWRPSDEDAPPPAPTPAPAATPPAPVAQPLTHEEITSVVLQTQDNLHVCVQENLGTEAPHLHVTLGFVVDAQGRASGLSIQGLESLPSSRDIAACFTRVAGLWHFRAPPAAQNASTALDL